MRTYGRLLGAGYDPLAGSRILQTRFRGLPSRMRAAETGRADSTARPHARTDGTARPGPARQAA